jgi:hypothetical protein
MIRASADKTVLCKTVHCINDTSGYVWLRVVNYTLTIFAPHIYGLRIILSVHGGYFLK